MHPAALGGTIDYNLHDICQHTSVFTAHFVQQHIIELLIHYWQEMQLIPVKVELLHKRHLCDAAQPSKAPASALPAQQSASQEFQERPPPGSIPLHLRHCLA